MALANAILVLLSQKPRSGYDLAKTFDSSIGFFWRADHQQIYRELGRLRDSGLVEAEEIVQIGRPNKLVYSCTKSGLTALKAWSQQPAPVPPVRDEFLVRLYALDRIDLPAFVDELTRRLELHEERLAKFERILADHFADEAMSLAKVGRYLGLKRGLGHEAGLIAWCKEALQMLNGMTSRTSRTSPKAAHRRMH